MNGWAWESSRANTTYSPGRTPRNLKCPCVSAVVVCSRSKRFRSFRSEGISPEIAFDGDSARRRPGAGIGDRGERVVAGLAVVRVHGKLALVGSAHPDELIADQVRTLRRPAAFQSGGSFLSAGERAFCFPLTHKRAELFDGIF